MQNFKADGGTEFEADPAWVEFGHTRITSSKPHRESVILNTNDLLQFVAEIVRERRIEDYEKKIQRSTIINMQLDRASDVRLCKHMHWREVLGLPEEE